MGDNDFWPFLLGDLIFRILTILREIAGNLKGKEIFTGQKTNDKL